jgi:hypothetical protein
MSALDLSINRDLENDVLYVFDNRFDRSKTINRHVNSDVVVRVDGDNHQVAGFTITDFSHSMPRLSRLKEYELMEEFDFIISSLNAIHSLEHKV